jgi:hypothetical protein
MELRIRRQEGMAGRWGGWFKELPPWQRAAVIGIPLAVGALALVARRRAWQGVAVVASAVEEVADTVEDAAENLRDTARERAGAKS